MADAIAVLNAGSSSIKFSLFVVRARELEPELGGQIEGLYTAPHFVGQDRTGRAPWASPRWTGCRWARAAAPSTRA